TIVVGSGGVLTLDNGASPATIAVTSGSHTIDAPVALKSSVNITTASGTTLTITGGISGSGQSLTLNGPGKLVLGGNNSFGGGTSVVSGTLVVNSSTALPDGSNLTVGANAGQAFAPIVAAAPVASPAIDSTHAAARSITTDIRGKALLAVVQRPVIRNPAWYAASRFWSAPVSESQENDAVHRAWDAALAKYSLD
ncbi:MAG TPA: autotransporter-associated beta strand repeat-containing protein, partial [Pirellulales bacterium]|nr:autotransporter-associated beta strand repeat-containing protein [Pirellulales bacterium]